VRNKRKKYKTYSPQSREKYTKVVKPKRKAYTKEMAKRKKTPHLTIPYQYNIEG
jgi:hypothetical protein